MALQRFPNPALNPPTLPRAAHNASVQPVDNFGAFLDLDFDAYFDPDNQAQVLDLPPHNFDYAGPQAAMLEQTPNAPPNLGNGFGAGNVRFQGGGAGYNQAPACTVANDQRGAAVADAQRRVRTYAVAQREAAVIQARVVQAQDAITRAQAQGYAAQAQEYAARAQGTFVQGQTAPAQAHERIHAQRVQANGQQQTARVQAAEIQRDFAAAGMEFVNYDGTFINGILIPNTAQGAPRTAQAARANLNLQPFPGNNGPGAMG